MYLQRKCLKHDLIAWVPQYLRVEKKPARADNPTGSIGMGEKLKYAEIDGLKPTRRVSVGCRTRLNKSSQEL